jgi:hypothetical protein
MIAKHVPMQSVKKSDFAGLVEYLADEQQKYERVGAISVTNCHSDRPDAGVLEILNTQAQNTRAESDKTYHLIISFRAGEQPDNATLKDIESKICEGLGYGEHQRISVVHRDTDNLHIHLAINKIHPLRYTIHAPYNDHKTLGLLCEKLELAHNLERDNHQAQKRGGENRAGDMERHAGIESFLGWIRRECLGQIQGVQSWAELHKTLMDNGLEIRERGNGLVITNDRGLTVKASSVARELSKGKLESRLGAFEPIPEYLASLPKNPLRQYAERPIKTQANTVGLYAQYLAEQRGAGVALTAELTKARDQKTRLIEAAKRNGRLKRAAIKLMTGPGVRKKALYAVAGKALKNEIEKINKQYLAERKTVFEKNQRLAWADWLRRKATQGDQQALVALRAREGAKALKGNTVTAWGGPRVAAAIETKQDSITKKGTIIYQVGTSIIRDDGEKLKVSRGVTSAGLKAALTLTMERYGSRITVNGSHEFKEQIVRIAVAANLPVTFEDVALEKQRQTLMSKKEAQNDQPERTDRGRKDRGRTSGFGSTARNGSAGNTSAGGERTKPNISKVGQGPPPEAQNRLRRLSQLSVVQLSGGSEVLLPGHVPNHLEHQGTKSNDRVRRDVSGPGVATPIATAAEKYVAEREEKRLKGFDIKKHIVYNNHVPGPATFWGLRFLDGQALALLKRNEEIIVLPIDSTTQRQAQRLTIGESVVLGRGGAIKSKGRSRGQ